MDARRFEYYRRLAKKKRRAYIIINGCLVVKPSTRAEKILASK